MIIHNGFIQVSQTRSDPAVTCSSAVYVNSNSLYSL